MTASLAQQTRAAGRRSSEHASLQTLPLAGHTVAAATWRAPELAVSVLISVTGKD